MKNEISVDLIPTVDYGQNNYEANQGLQQIMTVSSQVASSLLYFQPTTTEKKE